MRLPNFRMLRRSAWVALPLALLLQSCATTGVAPKPLITGCQAFAPVYVSADDVLTDATARAILANNQAGMKLCGWTPKAKP